MAELHQRIERLWWSKRRPPLLLRLLTPLYAAISRRHLRRRAASVTAPSLPLISVGNITVGGSGKTPFVLWLVTGLQQQGWSPVILCRGDGGKGEAPVIVAADADAAAVGDEALLLKQQSGCPVISGRDRVGASHMAAALGDIIILDDGFQYRQLGRCCDIVLVPDSGIGNGHLIPAGPLREPVAALARADFVVRSGQAGATPLGSEREWHWQSRPATLVDAKQTGMAPPDEAVAVTGIARPHRFFDDLAATGVRLGDTRCYPDHYRYTADDADRLSQLPMAVAVTAKDAVKLAPLWPASQPLWVLQQDYAAESGLLPAILAHLPERERAQ